MQVGGVGDVFKGGLNARARRRKDGGGRVIMRYNRSAISQSIVLEATA